MWNAELSAVKRCSSRLVRHVLARFIPHSAFRTRRAFTLIELLTVVALIGLLAALLFPAFNRARNRAKRTACVSNLKQIGLAFAMYRQDFDGGLPKHLSVVNESYLRDARALLCPMDGKRGQIVGNDYFEGNIYLPSGVSYEYFPQWQIAQNLNWYDPAPDFGNGRWGDLTPLGGCPWHWASNFSSAQTGHTAGSAGWELILTLGGSVRQIRVEEPLADFTPGKYH
jgi:prepilin-type N-terminal cleavage/methylation domain-containing protein